MENFEVSVQRFNEFAEEYTQRFASVDSYSGSLDRFCQLIPTGHPKILELGCGPGNVTKYLLKRFPASRIIAIDLAPKMIEIARKQLPEVDFRIMDVRNISSIHEKFDAILCSFCLPFLSKSDAEKLIANCAGLLISGGVLYISTMEGDENKAGFESTSFSGNAEIYFNYHLQADLENAMKESGFLVDEIKLQDYEEPDGSLTTDLVKDIGQDMS
ncbi:MAG: class I SAM-dependent methyltransferase [Prolixibacteraceae bacterium]